MIDATATYIFSDGFESGNLNAWTNYAGTLSINNQTVNSGYYSVESIVVGNNQNLYYHVLGTGLPNPIDFREYIYINSTSVPLTSGNYYEVGGFASAAPNYGDGEICVFNVGGMLYWGVYYRDINSNTGFSFSISTSNSTSDAYPVSIGWNCVELKHTTGASGTSYGAEQLYVNGVSILDVSVDNYDRTPYYAVIGGSQLIANPNDSWNYYLGDVAVSGSYIGQLQYQLTMSTNYGTVTPASSLQNGGSTFVITATPPTAVQGERYIFQGWTGSGVGSYTGSSNPVSVIMTGGVTETASWEIQYYLAVTSANGSPFPLSGWYDSESSIAAFVATPVSGGSGTQYACTGWTGTGSVPASGITSAVTFVINAPSNITWNWQTQYYLTFAQYGMGSDFSGTVITVNGIAYNRAGFSTWTNPGTVFTFSYGRLLIVTANSEQYVLTGISGNSTSSSLTVLAPTTVIGAYQAQYYLTATSTYGSPSPSSGWFNNGTSITEFVASPVSGGTGTQYACIGWSGTGSIPASDGTSDVTFTISAASSITWSWQTQYLVSFVSNPSGIGTISPSGTNCGRMWVSFPQRLHLTLVTLSLIGRLTLDRSHLTMLILLLQRR